MNNYYESRLQEIRHAINEGNDRDALTLLDEELSMPYVPQPYFDVYTSLRDTLRIDKAPQSKYFESIEDISDALKGSDALKLKAVMSLERMNLRNDLEVIENMLVDITIDDWMKRQILLLLMDQDINKTITITLSGQSHTLNPIHLINPIATKEYNDAYAYLVESLESNNPSLLMLCVAELDEMVMSTFPFQLEQISGEEILKRVNSYLNAG